MNTEVRHTVNMPAEMAELIDSYWHTQRLTSRNEAIRRLLAYALDRKFGAAKAPKEKTR